MILNSVFGRPGRRPLLGAALLAFFVFPLFSQTVELSAAAPGILAPLFGEHLALPNLPAPQWQEEAGVQVARLRLKAPHAAAWRLDFRSLSLATGSQMFLYGLDAAGAIRSAHGPYEENGPLNLQGFATRVLEGAELSIEVRGRQETETWPFEIELIERIDPSQLEAARARGIAADAVYRPPKAEEPIGEVRSAWFDDQLAQYKVVDGKAVAEGDIVLGSADDVASGAKARAGKSTGRRESHDDSSMSLLWPRGVIPYQINYTTMFTPTGIVPDSELDLAIQAAIRMWNTLFPGMLVKRTTETNYVSIVRLAGTCQAELGKTGGKQ